MLELRNVTKRFGGNVAVDRLSFTVDRHASVGLIGPNGAGKTTVVNLVSGLMRVDGGSVLFKGERIESRPLRWVTRRGINRTFQISRELKALTVMENMLVAAQLQPLESVIATAVSWKGIRTAERSAVRRAFTVLELFQLDRLANVPAGRLSVGQKRLLELARSLMANPELLILDEPFAGLSPTTARNLADYVESVRARGVTLVIVEHNLAMVERLCERVIVMAQGRVLADGSMRQVREVPAVVQAYLGRAT